MYNKGTIIGNHEGEYFKKLLDDHCQKKKKKKEPLDHLFLEE